MNKSIFIQTGGYPLKGERLQELQTSFSIFNEFGALAGNFTIISGCELTGTKVGNGYININNEILEFREADGSGTPNVIIIEETVSRSFKNGAIKPVYVNRYATFGTAETSWPWSDFVRPFETKNIPGNLIEQLSSFAGLLTRVAALEAKQVPIIKVVSGTETVENRSVSGANQTDYTKNYVYVSPPVGYTMANLVGFMPSIAEIYWNGDVNNDDTLWCKHRLEADKITIICNNSENRSAAKVNYIGVWIKY